MPIGTTISYMIIAIIIGAIFGGIIRIIRRARNQKKDPVEQKLDRVIQLLDNKTKIDPTSKQGGLLFILKGV
ncbi:DUF4083 domain-containing protein [Bacillus toyonensis]|nr:DUF4083 domain-containing protein [Bacillus toyonensis]